MSTILYGHKFLSADRMRNYLIYETKRRNNIFLIEYPKLFATDRHWVNSNVLWLVCRNVVSFPKEYNLRRYFVTQPPNLADLDANEKRLKA